MVTFPLNQLPTAGSPQLVVRIGLEVFRGGPRKTLNKNQGFKSQSNPNQTNPNPGFLLSENCCFSSADPPKTTLNCLHSPLKTGSNTPKTRLFKNARKRLRSTRAPAPLRQSDHRRRAGPPGLPGGARGRLGGLESLTDFAQN